ncbi:MAG TPA: thioredoxin domain-containing protein [Kofleriaceae bacterium]|nr:thioredoxin domain-containing protein [Kofleriaceae bacterium]
MIETALRPRTRALLAGAIAVVVAAWLPASSAAQRRYYDPAETYRISVSGAPARGPADAPVTIVEFSDFQCRFCVRAQDTLAEVEALYPGRVRVVFRNNPLDPEDSTLAAEAAFAAQAQGRYWAMHDRLFANPVRLTRAVVEGYALELGLDVARFRRELDERVHLDAVLRDAKLSTWLGLASTPMFFVNGRPIKGAQPLSVFTSIIDDELGRDAAAGYEARQHGARERGEARDVTPVYDVADVRGGGRHHLAEGLPGHSRGPAGALVRLVVVSDFECGFCAREAPVLRRLEERFAGQLQVVYRHLPLSMHRNAELAAEAAVVAGASGKFWELHDRFFTHEGPLTRPVIEEYGRAIGLDMTELRAALDDRRHRGMLARRAAALRAIGISATPTMFVNGEPISGAKSLEVLAEVVERRLAEAKRLVASGVGPTEVYDRVMKQADVIERR